MTLAEIEALIRKHSAEIEESEQRRSEFEVQLQEVTATIARLELRGVAVPDALRELKLSCHKGLRDADQAEDILDEVDTRLSDLRALMPCRYGSGRGGSQKSGEPDQTAPSGGRRQGNRISAMPEPVVDPYKHAATLAKQAGPPDGQVSYETRGKKHTLVLVSDKGEMRAVCRYSRCMGSKRKWWFGVAARDLDEADHTCLLLCDDRGTVQHAAMLPHDWLSQVCARFSPRRNGGYSIEVRERSGEIAIYSRGWRQPLREWLDNWEDLWPA